MRLCILAGMKIISYNVNGIRAALRKDILEWLKSASPDVLCLQEIKAAPDQFDPNVFKEVGYQHNYWYPAQKKDIVGWRYCASKNQTT